MWCFTLDPEKKWDVCKPIGLALGDCLKGKIVEDPQMQQIMKYVAYVLWGIAAIWLLLIIINYNRIILAIALNKVAANFIIATPSVIGVPIVTIGTAIIWSVGWAFCAAFLVSQVPADYITTDYFESYEVAYGTATVPGRCNDKWPQGQVWRTSNCTTDGGVAKCWRCYPPRYTLDWRFAISFFSYLWNNALLVAIGQCTVAGAAATWFFMPNKDKYKFKGGTVKIGVTMACKFHIGSLCFGSFILAVVQFIRYVMKYIEKQASAQKNMVMVYLSKIIQCCLWCLEKFIKFLNKNAYIQIALFGKNFCTSAKAAFWLIFRNLARFGTVATLGVIIHNIGFMFIMTMTGMIGLQTMTSIYPEKSPIFPGLMFLGIGYMSAKLYMCVFGLAVDTCLQCFIAVEEMERITYDFIPKELKKLLNKKKGKK